MADNATGVRAMLARIQRMATQQQAEKDSNKRPWHKHTLKGRHAGK